MGRPRSARKRNMARSARPTRKYLFQHAHVVVSLAPRAGAPPKMVSSSVDFGYDGPSYRRTGLAGPLSAATSLRTLKRIHLRDRPSRTVGPSGQALSQGGAWPPTAARPRSSALTRVRTPYRTGPERRPGRSCDGAFGAPRGQNGGGRPNCWGSRRTRLAPQRCPQTVTRAAQRPNTARWITLRAHVRRRGCPGRPR